MIGYHFSWDLDRFGLTHADFGAGPWQWAGRSIGAGFLALMGASLVLHRARVLAARGAPPDGWHYLTRGATLFAAGLLITFATWLAIGPGFVWFGILHLLGVGTLLAPLFIARPALLQLGLGVLIIALGVWVHGGPPQSRWWVWVGMRTHGPAMVDWYPLLPWAGYILLGSGLASLALRRGWALAPQPRLAASSAGRALAWLGRHSLVIYLLHQPLLLAAFHIAGFR